MTYELASPPQCPAGLVLVLFLLNFPSEFRYYELVRIFVYLPSGVRSWNDFCQIRRSFAKSGMGGGSGAVIPAWLSGGATGTHGGFGKTPEDGKNHSSGATERRQIYKDYKIHRNFPDLVCFGLGAGLVWSSVHTIEVLIAVFFYHTGFVSFASFLEI